MEKITAYQSLQIEKKIEEIRHIANEHINFFYCKDQRGRLIEMKEQINDILENIIPE